MPGALSGRVALVTGAARGIGLAIATRLAEASAPMIIHDRDEHWHVTPSPVDQNRWAQLRMPMDMIFHG